MKNIQALQRSFPSHTTKAALFHFISYPHVAACSACFQGMNNQMFLLPWLSMETQASSQAWGVRGSHHRNRISLSSLGRMDQCWESHGSTMTNPPLPFPHNPHGWGKGRRGGGKWERKREGWVGNMKARWRARGVQTAERESRILRITHTALTL